MVADWLADLAGSSLTVEVPASSANLGAGYDCLAVALAMVNRISLQVHLEGEGEGGIELTVDGEGHDALRPDRGNRFVRGLEAALRAARGEIPDGVGWRIAMHNQIPLARGLGSSAAATVAGLLAGNALAGDPLSTAELLQLATEIEGHPDNAAAALLGGFVVAASSGAAVEGIRFDVPADLRAVLFIPELRLETAAMRAVLPAGVRFDDAVANLGAVAIGVAGIATGRYDVLRWLTVDRLHEPHRAATYPQLPSMVEAARAAGAIGACLSGAGSTILAFSDTPAAIVRIEAAWIALAADSNLPGRVAVVELRGLGARVLTRT